MYRIQNALLRFLQNFKPRALSVVLGFFIFPFGRPYSRPHDRLDHLLAHNMMQPSEFRDRLTAYCYQGNKEQDADAMLDYALQAMCEAEPILAKIDAALKGAVISKDLANELFLLDNMQVLRQKNIVTREEAETLLHFEKLRKKVIAVDEFSNEQLQGKG